jgi:two-component system response regulator FixJ
MDDSPTIVLIEDDDATRDSLRLLLDCEGVPVRDFASCREFLDAQGSAKPDCLILDIHTLCMPGLELLGHLRAQGETIPIILMTDHRTPAIVARAETAGVLAVIEMPFEGNEVTNVVRSVLVGLPSTTERSA